MNGEGFQLLIIDKEKGKGLFTRRLYHEGEIIFQEKPIISSQFAWNTEYGYLACDNCMRPLESAEENARRLTGNNDLILPYPECCETNKEFIVECLSCGIKYCSNDCLNEAMMKYHKTLCIGSKENNENHPLKQLEDIWKKMHYPPETATIMLLAKMVAYINQSDDKFSVLSIFNQFCHRTTNKVQEITHNLLGEKFIDQIDLLRQSMEQALNHEYTPHWFTPDGFTSLLALIGTNGQGIGTSAFSRWVNNVSALELPDDQRIQVDKFIDKIYDKMEEVVGTFLNNEGSGLYILQSSINHSCTPNAVVEFPYSNSTLIIRAMRDIQPNEEICIGYLDECELERSRHSRQKNLKSLYLFICRCNKCIAQEDDPDCTSEDDGSDMVD